MDSRLRNIVPNERLIFALDVPGVERAMELVRDLSPSVKFFYEWRGLSGGGTPDS